MHVNHAKYYEHTSTRGAHVQHTCWPEVRGASCTRSTRAVTHTSLMVGVLRVQWPHSGVQGVLCAKNYLEIVK